MAAKTYLVGGAVRDELLGLPVQDRDWVVVGATTEEMLDAGFLQVGRDFPVFLHPTTREEHALARTERKLGVGHTGFVVHAAPDVSLEQDLARRDLTINAMAKDQDGLIIDPFGGREDLSHGTLRHVSAAFVEDPLRVFRVARFAALLRGFQVARETLDLMSQIVASGELNSLSKERVWAETQKAFSAQDYPRYFEVLADCGALQIWFEELVPHQLQTKSVSDPTKRFALLPLSAAEFVSLGERLGIPKSYAQLASDRLQHEAVLKDWSRRGAQVLLDPFEQLGVQHDLHRLKMLVALLELDPEPLLSLAANFATVKLPEDTPLTGPDYGAALREARARWLRQYKLKSS